ncbi:MAG: hypothetical protein JSS26_20375 [Nitrospira sp.]|nr:hypothetical protein [Nitrospira sp.]
MAARHALHKYDADLSFSRASAEDFLEEVTVANPSKFTIAGDANIDPAKKAMYWPPSKPYIVADLDLIKPDIIIVPRTILSKLSGRKVGLGASLRSFTILPNWQITSRTVRNARRVVPGKNLSKIELSPFSIWKLTRGAERWGMEYYLQWLDVIAKDWKQMSAVS